MSHGLGVKESDLGKKTFVETLSVVIIEGFCRNFLGVVLPGEARQSWRNWWRAACGCLDCQWSVCLIGSLARA